MAQYGDIPNNIAMPSNTSIRRNVGDTAFEAYTVFSGSYNDLTNKPTIPAAQIQSDWNQANTGALDYIKNKPTVGAGTVTSVNMSSSDLAVSGGPITTTGSMTVNLNTSGVSAGTYSGVTVTTKGIVTAGTNRSFANTGRSLNTAFQISSTRDALVSYSVDISTSVSLAGGAVGTVFLEYADDSGFTTNVVEASRFVNGNTGTLVVGLTLNQTNTAPLGGVIPAAKYARLRTVNTTGTPTFTFRSAQEVLL